MEKLIGTGCLLVLLCSTVTACGSEQKPLDNDAASAVTMGEQKKSDEKAAALAAALTATGNDYPTPALFVKRWNLLTQWLPEVQIATFTSLGHQNDPRPVAELASLDFTNIESISLQLGASNMSIEYVTLRDDLKNIGVKERPNSYSITIKRHERIDGGHVDAFSGLCVWEIRSAKTSISLHWAVQLFANAVHSANATDRRMHAEAEGVSLSLSKNGENATCEVKEVDSK